MLPTSAWSLLRILIITKALQTSFYKTTDVMCSFLARDAFVRTNRRAIAMMFVHPSVCQSGTGVYCDHTVHFSADLSLWLESTMFWHQSTSTYSPPSFSNSTWKTVWVWKCKLGVISQEQLMIEVELLLSANRKSYMPRQLAQQRMTLSDLKWLKSTSST